MYDESAKMNSAMATPVARDLTLVEKIANLQAQFSNLEDTINMMGKQMSMNNNAFVEFRDKVGM